MLVRPIQQGPICELLSAHGVTTDTLVQLMDVEDRLKLQFLCDQACYCSSESMMHHSHNVENATRILYYCTMQSTKYYYQLPMVGLWPGLIPFSYLIASSMTPHITVNNGIEILLVLHLSGSSESLQAIDQVLRRIQRGLTNRASALEISETERTILEGIPAHDIHIYSNIPALSKEKSILKLYQLIRDSHMSTEEFFPLSVNLRITNDRPFSDVFRWIEDPILILSEAIRHLRFTWSPKTAQSIGEHWEQFQDIGKNYWYLLEWVCQLRRRLVALVINTVTYRQPMSKIHYFLNDEEMRFFHKETHDLLAKARKLLEMVQSFHESGNSCGFGATKDDIQQQELPRINSEQSTVCSEHCQSGDHKTSLRVPETNDPCTFQVSQLYNPIDGPLRVNNVRLKLSLFLRLSPSHAAHNSMNVTSSSVPPVAIDSSEDHQQESFTEANSTLIPSTEEFKTINVLLLGETGVGKSTFINALANYLAFETLQGAVDGNPLVLIPVSFIITTGANFDEKVVDFGTPQHPENEDFNEQGRSVTQKCEQYTFELPSHRGKRIRIIDTPGFCDTRGVEQDQKNIDHIKSYINEHCPSIDAVCLLLKPNESRLIVNFRLCFSLFASILGENAHRKIFFCFTNARSTFYAPGNTGPLLRQMLSTLNIAQPISMRKENTFCFDNESFRYLVAKKNRIDLGETEKEYQMSWTVSVKQATRLMNAILEP